MTLVEFEKEYQKSLNQRRMLDKRSWVRKDTSKQDKRVRT